MVPWKVFLNQKGLGPICVSTAFLPRKLTSSCNPIQHLLLKVQAVDDTKDLCLRYWKLLPVCVENTDFHGPIVCFRIGSLMCSKAYLTTANIVMPLVRAGKSSDPAPIPHHWLEESMKKHINACAVTTLLLKGVSESFLKIALWTTNQFKFSLNLSLAADLCPSPMIVISVI